MEYKQSTFQISTPTNFLYEDQNSKMFWSLVNEALLRGEDVIFRLTSAHSTLNPTTLMQVGKDDKGNPLFGIGPKTRVDVVPAFDVLVNVPKPSESAPSGESAKE